eukprot:CAMPEP_0113321272 /NCGR_PEP_ID=MMETSP0010_2-20120614/14808_1 /TAXON_ID=216773 ORGANISM="Corethron hystrix, Strain 308" /NCGR_SAMPLE_ID=MMETSP0010_2 /ASSEMBLY_ACC=CAM_ASM_000155 /LENGTH=512 /DNA_ID=CAMNT_0000179343 /DNA_START=39 /DNA_END=1577 /DNA_ORIENTATION=- /assembly_acc=CAM_ASM_000155
MADVTNDPPPEAPKKDKEDLGHEPMDIAPGCGILGQYPLTTLLVFAVLGIVLGIIFSNWKPESGSVEDNTKDIVIQWIGLLGDIFIRALKCVVVPLVFFNVVIATMEMMSMGKASSVGWKTILVYFVTTLFATICGVISTLIFANFYSTRDFAAAEPPMIQLGCSDPDTYLMEFADGSISCANESNIDGGDQFLLVDQSNYYVKNSSEKPNISLSDTIYQGVFYKLVSSNIFKSFASGDLLAIVFFAIIFGIALQRIREKGRTSLYEIIKECDDVFLQIIIWIIKLTPFAVFSLIAKRLGSDDNLSESFSNVGYLFACTLVGMLFHLVVTHFIVFPLVTKINPFSYLKHMIPALAMAFASSSSAATLPVTMSCVEATGRVKNNISNFVLPLGATINMDGTAIYIPTACIWMAYLNGITPNAAQYIVLIILGTVGSAGAAPVPSASLVLIITAYNTVFNQSGTPDGFSFILAIDWLVDSFRTMLNVTGDAVVSAAVDHIARSDGTDEENGEDA